MRLSKALLVGFGLSATLAYDAPTWLPKANGTVPAVLPQVQRPQEKSVDFLSEITSAGFGILVSLVLDGIGGWLFPKDPTQKTMVDLSTEALTAIKDIMKIEIDNAFLNEYKADAKTLMDKAGSNSAYWRRVSLYEQFPDAWPVFWQEDDNDVTSMIDKAIEINNRLNSNLNFGLVPIKTYQLISAIRIAFLKERIGLYRWANSSAVDLARIQCDLKKFADEFVKQLDVDYRERYKWHLDTMFKTRMVDDGLCWGYWFDDEHIVHSIHCTQRRAYVDRKKDYRWSDSSYVQHQNMGYCCQWDKEYRQYGYQNDCPDLQNLATARATSLRDKFFADNKTTFLGESFEANINKVKELQQVSLLDHLYP